MFLNDLRIILLCKTFDVCREKFKSDFQNISKSVQVFGGWYTLHSNPFLC